MSSSKSSIKLCLPSRVQLGHTISICEKHRVKNEEYYPADLLLGKTVHFLDIILWGLKPDGTGNLDKTTSCCSICGGFQRSAGYV